MPSEPAVPAEKGLNRFVWDLTYPGPVLEDDALMYLGYSGGPTAVPGTYRVRLTLGDWSQSRTLTILKDPRVETTIEDYQEQHNLMIRVRDKLTEAHDAIRILRDVRRQVEALAGRLTAVGHDGTLQASAREIRKELTSIEEKLIQTKNEAHQDPINFPPQLDTRFGFLYGYIHSLNGKPTEGAYRRLEDLEPRLVEQLDRLAAVLGERLQTFSERVQALGVEPVVVKR